MGSAAVRARLALGDLAQVDPAGHLDVTVDVHIANMDVVAVRSGHHPASPLEGEVGENGHLAHPDGSQAPGMSPERFEDFLRAGRTHCGGEGGVYQFLLLEVVVAAQQHQGELPIDHVDQGLDLPHRVGVARKAGSQRGDGPNSRRVEFLDLGHLVGVGHRIEARCGSFHVRPVAA